MLHRHFPYLFISFILLSLTALTQTKDTTRSNQYANSLDIDFGPLIGNLSLASGNHPNTNFFYQMNRNFSLQYRRHFHNFNLSARGNINEEYRTFPFNSSTLPLETGVVRITDSTVTSRNSYYQKNNKQFNIGIQKNIGKHKTNLILGIELLVGQQQLFSNYNEDLYLITKDTNGNMSTSFQNGIITNGEYGTHRGNHFVEYFNIGATLDLGIEYFFSKRISASILYTPSYIYHFKKMEDIYDPGNYFTKDTKEQFSNYVRGYLSLFVTYQFNGKIKRQIAKSK